MSPALAITNEGEIRVVRIELTVEVGRGGVDPTRHTLMTEIHLRNREEQG